LEEAGGAGALDLALAEYHLSGPAAGISVMDRTPEPKRDGDYWLLRAQMLDAQGDAQAAAEALNRGFAAAPRAPTCSTRQPCSFSSTNPGRCGTTPGTGNEEAAGRTG